MIEIVVNFVSTNGFVIILLFDSVLLIFTKVKRKTRYWESRNIPCSSSNLLSKETYRILTLADHPNLQTQRIYDSTSSPYIGYYAYTKPVLMVKDLELINKILIKDFDHFVNRFTPSFFIKEEPIFSKNLVFAQGQEWKKIRTVVTPSFTSKKIKIMSKLVLECVEILNTILNERIRLNDEFSVREIYTKMIIDVIAAAFFGIKSKCLEGNNQFTNQLRKLGNFDFVRSMAYKIAPKFCRLLNLRIIPPEDVKFISDIVNDVIRQKNQQVHKREDLVQHLIDIYNEEQNVMNENSTTEAKQGKNS